MFKSRRERGFTMIELMIVVAIMAILLAILMPTVGRARRMARYTQCAANLRQFSLAANSYALQNNGQFPTLAIQGTGANLWDIPLTFYDALRKGGMPHEAFFCPGSDLPEFQEQRFNQYTAFRIIAYNVWIPRSNGGRIVPPEPGATPFSYPSPGTVAPFSGPTGLTDAKRLDRPIFTDCVGTTGSTPAAGQDISGQHNLQMLEISAHMEMGRLRNINAGYADGHVESIPGNQVRPRFMGNWWNWR